MQKQRGVNAAPDAVSSPDCIISRRLRGYTAGARRKHGASKAIPECGPVISASLHGQGKRISAIHRRAWHAIEAHGRPASVEGGKEMCPPARSDPVPGPWKAYARRRWISIPLHAQGLLSLSPTGNVNYARKPAGRIPGSESGQKRKTAEMTVFP